MAAFRGPHVQPGQVLLLYERTTPVGQREAEQPADLLELSR
jgi:hypothetical protein